MTRDGLNALTPTQERMLRHIAKHGDIAKWGDCDGECNGAAASAVLASLRRRGLVDLAGNLIPQEDPAS